MFKLAVFVSETNWLQAPCQATDHQIVCQRGPQPCQLSHWGNHARPWHMPNSCRVFRSQKTRTTRSQVWEPLL